MERLEMVEKRIVDENDNVEKIDIDRVTLLKKYPHLFDAEGEFLEDVDIEDVCIIDTSAKVGYNLPIPISPELLGDKEVDYKLIYILAYLCDTDFKGMKTNGKPDLRRYITKDVINRVARKLYGRARDTFNKKLKVLKDKRIFIQDSVDKEQLNYNYEKVGQFVTCEEISNISPLILDADISENTFRIYSYMLLHCRELKHLDYGLIITNIGLKNLNRGVVKGLIKPLLDLKLVCRHQTIKEVGENRIQINNYYKTL